MAAEADYYLGLLDFTQGDVAGFGHAAECILQLVPGPFEVTNYDVPLAHTRARSYEALTAVAIASGNYHSAPAQARLALDEFADNAIADKWILASNIVNLVAFAAEFDIANDAQWARDLLEATSWPQELATRRWTVLNALGWCAALRGDNIGAFRDFRKATAAASSDVERVISTADRATLADKLDQKLVAREELEHALEMTRSIDWESTPGDQRVALLTLADALAPVAPDDAREMLNRYRKIRSAMPVLSLSRMDPRVRATENFSEARVARAEGRLDFACDRFRAAFTFWVKAGFVWRAASAATELAVLGAGDQFAAYAKREAGRRSTSWLARRVASLTA